MSNNRLKRQEAPFSKGLLTISTRKCFRRDKYATYALRVTLQYHSVHMSMRRTMYYVLCNSEIGDFDPLAFTIRALSTYFLLFSYSFIPMRVLR